MLKAVEDLLAVAESLHRENVLVASGLLATNSSEFDQESFIELDSDFAGLSEKASSLLKKHK